MTGSADDVTGSQRGNSGSSGRLEMPFASVPESISSPATDSSSSPVRSVQIPAPIPAAKEETTDEEEAVTTTTTTANTSSASQSPRDEVPDRSKSPAESSEVDLDSLSGQLKTESVDVESSEAAASLMAVSVMPATTSRIRGGGAGMKRKATAAVASDVGSRSPLHGGKRKRRTREAASTRGGRGGRGRHGSDRLLNDDFDDDDHHHRNVVNLPSLGNLDNEARLSLTQRSPNSKKYNFFVDLGKKTHFFTSLRVAGSHLGRL